jgi:uncharacterized protein (TIRG00374 family)
MTEPSAARPSRWSWILPAVLAAILLVLFLRGVDWGQVWRAIVSARWQYLGGGALASCGSYFLRSCRWRILLNAEQDFSIGTVFSANMAGYLGNNFLPARAGEFIRTFIISSRSSLTKTYVLTTALAERMMDAIALVLWSSIVLLGVNPKPAWLEAMSGVTTAMASVGALAIVVLPHTHGLVQAVIRRLPMPAGWRPRLLQAAEQVLAGLRVFHDFRRLGGFALLTVVVWSLDAVAVMVGGRAFDLDIKFRVAALLLTGMGLGSALPSTPGYVGIYQAVAITVLVPFGISKESALAYMLVNQAVGYVVVVALGLPAILQYRGWRRLQADTIV